MEGKSSRYVYVPSAVSSFFEVCDRDESGNRLSDPLKIGARGGGLKLKKGTYTKATSIEAQSDVVLINGSGAEAKTTRRVIEGLRRKYGFGAVRVEHHVELPIGSGFGTSGAGALACVIALSDLFGLNLTLSQAARYAHVAEVESVTGLGTVTALAYGGGAFGLVTQPGAYGMGVVDSILDDHEQYVAVCVWFGPIEKASVLLSEEKVRLVNRYGGETLHRILEEGTVEALLSYSRVFAEKSGIASQKLLEVSDTAKKCGAVGATQNMIGNAVHCLVRKERLEDFLARMRAARLGGEIFVSDLTDSGPRVFSSKPDVNGLRF